MHVVYSKEAGLNEPLLAVVDIKHDW